MTESAVRTVLFDIGGVVVGSPIHGAADVERELNLPAGWVGVAIASRGSSGVWARLERGELRLPDAYPLLEAELNDTPFIWRAYTSFLERRKLQRALPHPGNPSDLPHIDARYLVGCMMRRAGAPFPDVIRAIRRLRQAGIHVAALTNTLLPPDDEREAQHIGMQAARVAQLQKEFDAYFSSAQLGMRKPEARFYQHALDVLKASAASTVFLDDIRSNLKAAAGVGIQSIFVDSSNVGSALAQLQAVTKVDLGLPAPNVRDRAEDARTSPLSRI